MDVVTQVIDQVQLFLVAAACFTAGIGLLIVALRVWELLLDRVCRLVGIHGAVMEVLVSATSRKRWWWRVATWYRRAVRKEDL